MTRLTAVEPYWYCEFPAARTQIINPTQSRQDSNSKQSDRSIGYEVVNVAELSATESVHPEDAATSMLYIDFALVSGSS